jgi:D-sedoheptulose 7-phosphate isomerase
MNTKNDDIAREHLVKHRKTVETLSGGNFYNIIQEIADICIEAIFSGNKIIFMGNGGSAADAQHLAAELIGRYLEERRPLSAIALNVNTSVITAVANDYSYEDIFARQIEGIGRAGDVLIGLSTSGRSRNIIKGLRMGRKCRLKTIVFVGNYKDDVVDICDNILSIPENYTPIIQEMHIMAGHIICGIIERNIKLKDENAGYKVIKE